MVNARIPDSWEYQPDNWCEIDSHREKALKIGDLHFPPGNSCPFCPVLAGTKEFLGWSNDHYHCSECYGLTQIG